MSRNLPRYLCPIIPYGFCFQDILVQVLSTKCFGLYKLNYFRELFAYRTVFTNLFQFGLFPSHYLAEVGFVYFSVFTEIILARRSRNTTSSLTPKPSSISRTCSQLCPTS